MRSFAIALLSFGLLSIVALAQEQVKPPTTEEVLDQVRTALGVADFKADHPGLKASGRIKHYGIEDDYELTLDGQGRFRVASNGPLGDCRVFDGKTASVLDWTESMRHLHIRDRDVALTNTWLVSGFWAARPELFDLAVVPEKCTEKEAVLSLRRKDGLLRFAVAIDRATGRPSGAKGKLRDQEHVYVFSDYADGPGLRLARQWTHAAAGVTTTVNLAKIQKCEALPETTFKQPPQRSKKATFDPGKAGPIQTKKANSGHLLVRPKIGGEEVGWFIFDSGAGHMCIGKELAQKLELDTFGEVPVAGVGGVLKSRFCKSRAFALGPVTLAEPTYVELDLRSIGLMMGEEIGGIVGYPLLQGAVAEIDCLRPSIALHDPAAFALPEGTAWTKLIIDGNHPIVEGKYEGDRTGLFRLDTGAPNHVSFHTPAVKKHKLLEGRQTRMTMQGGVGGVIRSKFGNLAWFELAGHRFPDVRAEFSEVEKGAFADEYTDGNLGQGVLAPFRVVFDYGGERIAFVKKK